MTTPSEALKYWHNSAEIFEALEKHGFEVVNSAEASALFAKFSQRVDELEQSLAACLLIIHECEPKDKSKTEYYRDIVSKAHSLLSSIFEEDA
jgi:histidinol-phosphate/aromatic aminotransferase/cobyric acid decarboxylase-like protein